MHKLMAVCHGLACDLLTACVCVCGRAFVCAASPCLRLALWRLHFSTSNWIFAVVGVVVVCCYYCCCLARFFNHIHFYVDILLLSFQRRCYYCCCSFDLPLLFYLSIYLYRFLFCFLLFCSLLCFCVFKQPLCPAGNTLLKMLRLLSFFHCEFY